MADQTTTAPADDLFEDVVADYVTIDDLDTRHVVVLPDRIETAESTSQPGKTYERIIGDVLVLDGPVTEKITEIPFVVTEMYLNATNVVNRLKSSVKDRKPRLGRVDSVPSKRNKKVKAFGFQPVDASNREVRDKANAAIVAYRESQHEADPFAAN